MCCLISYYLISITFCLKEFISGYRKKFLLGKMKPKLVTQGCTQDPSLELPSLKMSSVFPFIFTKLFYSVILNDSFNCLTFHSIAAQEREQMSYRSLPILVVKCVRVPKFTGLNIITYLLSLPCSGVKDAITNLVPTLQQSLLLSEVIRRLHWEDFIMIYSKENGK